MISAADKQLIADNVPFTRLKDSRILITGGSGFIGQWMGAAPVRLVSLSRDQYENSGWQNGVWDYIIHLAPTPPDKVIECAARCMARVLYASSGAVHDKQPGDYALGKIAAETALLDGGIDCSIARLYSFSGPGCHHAAREMCVSAVQDGVIRYNVKSTRSYLYAADLAIWLWRLLLDGQPNGVYDVGGIRPVTMRQLAHEVRRHLPALQHIELIAIDAPDPRPYYVPERARETMLELGVKEYTAFEDGIGQTVMWVRGMNNA